jgi:hypothetical protein
MARILTVTIDLDHPDLADHAGSDRLRGALERLGRDIRRSADAAAGLGLPTRLGDGRVAWEVTSFLGDVVGEAHITTTGPAAG